MKATPDTIVARYWRYPWTFKANGDLHVQHPQKVIVFTQAEYLPKSQWVTA